MKPEWRAVSLGWFAADGALVGAGLALLRPVPRLRRFFAYLPEGPDLDWDAVATDPRAWLDPLVAALRAQGAFAVRIGPQVVLRRWSAATIKQAMAAAAVRTLPEVPADEAPPAGARLLGALTAAGWRPPDQDSGFTAGQPRFVFQVPLAGRDEAAVLAGFNQLWRRNVKKAAKAGVAVSRGTAADLPAFHALYVETARRDGFTPRPLAYFEGMWAALTAEDPERLRLYLARHDGVLVAATTMVRVGAHAWYSYGASSTERREVRGSNAVQWQMIRDALAAGATVYDLRGITETIAADDPHVGLIQFKLGTGGEAVEYVGEWTQPTGGLVAAALYQGFTRYLARRGRG